MSLELASDQVCLVLTSQLHLLGSGWGNCGPVQRIKTILETVGCCWSNHFLGQLVSQVYHSFGENLLSLDMLISSLFQKFNLTRAGPLLGAERAGPGGECFNTPRLTRLLGHLVTCGKRHSKERKKSWRNCFGHFLGQVKGQVTRGHQRSNFVNFNIFLQIGT